jgi:hypothetical protein
MFTYLLSISEQTDWRSNMKLRYKVIMTIVLIVFIFIAIYNLNTINMREDNKNIESVGTVIKINDDVEQKQESHIDSEESNEITSDKDKTSTTKESERKEITEVKNVGIDPKKSFGSHYDFPYDKIPFTDDDIFEIIKDSYAKVNFYGEFKKGDMGTYNYYKKKFYQLLNSEVYFVYNKKTDFSYPIPDGKLFINDLLEVKNVEDLKNYQYYFFDFDMDKDSAPELCISDGDRFVDIFKYLKDEDKFVLWYEIPPSHGRLSGSRKMRSSGDGVNQAFYVYDENGTEECRLYFYSKGEYNEKKANWDDIYMAGVPVYADREGPIKISDAVKKKGYFSEAHQMYFYRLKKEQYEQLEKSFYDAEDQAVEELEKVTYTYEELFGEYDK